MATYIVRGEGCEEKFRARDDAAAARRVVRWLREAYDEKDISRSCRASAWLSRVSRNRRADPEDIEYVSVTLHPAEPECEEGYDHDWQAPYRLVGGCKENPGCWFSGHGGVRIHAVCMRCGCGRVTDTGDTDPECGARMESIAYTPGEYVAELSEESGDVNEA